MLAHDGDRRGPALVGERQVPIALDRQQPVPLHPRDRLADRGTALVQPLGDAGPQRRNTLLLQLEDRAQVHLGGIDEVMFVYALLHTFSNLRELRQRTSLVEPVPTAESRRTGRVSSTACSMDEVLRTQGESSWKRRRGPGCRRRRTRGSTAT